MRGASIAGRTGEALVRSTRPTAAPSPSRAHAQVARFSQSCARAHQQRASLLRPHSRIHAPYSRIHAPYSRIQTPTRHARALHTFPRAAQEAQQQQEAAASADSYRPAATWAGLEVIGGEKDWDTGKTFHPFGAAHKLSSPEEITMAIYRAVVEVYTVELAGRPQTPFGRPTPGALVNDTAHVKLACTEAADGARRVQLQFPSQAAIGNIVAALSDSYAVSAEAPAADPVPNYTAASLAAQLQAIGREWLHVPLTDHSIKLAVIRRVKQLTGLHIPDRVIDRARSVSYLVSELATPPPPPKLAQQLVASELAGVGNIQLFPRRHTPLDKEREVGRLKVIEQRLQEHGMRPLGRRAA